MKGIPFLKSRAVLVAIPEGQPIDKLQTYGWAKKLLKLLLGKSVVYFSPNRWWLRFLALQATAFCLIFIVAERVFLSEGWRNPFASSVSANGLTMAGWLYDLAFARSTNTPDGAHLVSYVGIPLIALSVIAIEVRKFWKEPDITKKFPDMTLGLLVAAFFVAIHEGIWETAYYIEYSQYLSWAVITNVLKDASFASMMVLFLLAFWKYPYRTISMRKFAWVVLAYTALIVGWFFVPYLFGYGIFPITTINNFLFGKGVYSVTQWWSNPVINFIEVFSWFGLYLMMQWVVVRNGGA